MEINKEEKKEFNILYEDGIYRILIDTYQFILTKVSVTTREDGTTSSYSTNLGYFSTLGQAFDYLLEILIKDKVKVSENFKKDIQLDIFIDFFTIYKLDKLLFSSSKNNKKEK